MSDAPDNPAPAPPIRLGAFYGSTAAAIIALAIGLRLYHLTHESFWGDELSSLQQSAGRPTAQPVPPLDVIHRPGIDSTSTATALPLASVWRNIETDSHPPLYPLLLRCWRAALSDGDAAARGFSVLCSLLSVILLLDACRLLHSPAVALWAAAIMAAATPQILFAQETRGYAMLVTFTLAACDALVRIETLGPSKRRIAALASCTVAALMTHYAAVPVVIALVVYALVKLRGTIRRDALIGTLLAAAVFAALWGPSAWRQRANIAVNVGWTADDPAPRAELIARTLWRAAVLPTQFFITPREADKLGAVGWLGAVFYAAALLMLIRRRDALLWVLLGGATIGAVAAGDLLQGRKGLEVTRYTLAATPAAYALVAAAGQLIPSRRLWHFLPAGVLLSCIVALPEAYNYWKSDYRSFARQLDRLAGADDVIISTYTSRNDWYEPLLLAAVTHYTFAERPRPIVVLSGPASEALRAELEAAPGVWLLNGASDPPVQRFFPGARAGTAKGVPFVGMFVKVELRPRPDHTDTATNGR